jgi:hypothetical protein
MRGHLLLAKLGVSGFPFHCAPFKSRNTTRFLFSALDIGVDPCVRPIRYCSRSAYTLGSISGRFAGLSAFIFQL